MYQGVLRDRFHRGPEEVRCPSPGAARRGRPDRSGEGLGAEVGAVDQRREGDLLPGCAPRHHSHAPGADQRRAASVPSELAGTTRPRTRDGRYRMKIVIIGGTGLIGSKLVTRLRRQGHQAVPASPDTGVNTLTGEGLARVLTGAAVVIDVSNSPSLEDTAVMEFFRTSTSNLLAAEAAAGVRHHVALSVVGTERLSESGYFRAKLAQEELIKASSIPFSIVRATQFFEFVKSIADAGTFDGTVHLAPVLIQPMAAEDVADAVGMTALGSP